MYSKVQDYCKFSHFHYALCSDIIGCMNMSVPQEVGYIHFYVVCLQCFFYHFVNKELVNPDNNLYMCCFQPYNLFLAKLLGPEGQ
jgi:hypothetical protein